MILCSAVSLAAGTYTILISIIFSLSLSKCPFILPPLFLNVSFISQESSPSINVICNDRTSDVKNQLLNSSSSMSITAFNNVNKYAEWHTMAISFSGLLLTYSVKNS
eukprot:CAMPEP_0184419570 /NCGR_PEP_ID=MMETSP0738-20130409/40194_1 /TAXON_ID=385413 /ORGANISM="Thalassiosira miniscula, Strain CCMP1093" /LENGTH=106 /DNA_ID=CAMNT_0026780101 /DNA_START=74 /DNA_END=394 /DNA_ORIENTATION=-